MTSLHAGFELRKNALARALEVVDRSAGCDGEHHKMWVINEMIRQLIGKTAWRAWLTRVNEDREREGYEPLSEGIPP